MKKYFFTMFVCLFCTIGMMAQKDGDKIIGKYQLDYSGKQSRIKIFKYGDGYRVQNYWAREGKNEDGTLKLDKRNPDKSKRTIPINDIVLIDKITYDGEKWCHGKIYDPTTGFHFNVEIRIKDENTLEVRGKVGPFYKKIYWTKLK